MFGRRLFSANFCKVARLSSRARSTNALKRVSDTRPTIFEPWEEPLKNIEALERNLFPRHLMRSLLAPLENALDVTPLMDIKETPKAYHIHMDLPGIKKKDIGIDIRDGILHIAADRAGVKSHENETMKVFERFQGHVSRQIRLPENISEECIEAHYADGVLTVNVPKNEVDEKAHEVKKIDVK